MNDIYIQVDTKTAKTECENNKIGVKHANLQNKLIFKMTEKIIGNAWLEYEIDGDKNYVEMEEIEEGYQIVIKSCLLISDYVNVDLKITETENADGIPVFVSTKEKLEVYDSINASKEEPEYYPDWKTVADSKIAEINQLKRDLNIAESTRIENENTRQSNETTRIENEAIRQTNEATRINNESTRVTAENERISAESGRVSSEAARSTAELVRVSNENTRISNEETRASNESTRTLNEQTRAANETVREEYISNLKKDVEDGKFDGNGIVSFSKTSTTGLVDTYTIVFTDGATTTLTVTNGKGISSIIKTSTIGLTDTYTITYNDNTTSTFQIINGRGIDSINLTSTQDNIDTYTINYNDGTTSTFTVTNSTVTDQEFDKLTNEVDKYKTIYNVLPKVSDEGTDIELKDTGNAMLAFDSFNGDTSQKTTTGKQLLDTSMYSLGSINGNTGEDEESSSVYRFDKYNEVNPNTTIYLLKHLCIYFYNENKGFISSDITGNLTITTPPNTKYIRFRIFTADFATFNPNDYMVSYTQETHFEPYTGGQPSLSPDYTQPIKIVTGEQNVKIQNKNILSAEMVKKINSKNTITTYQNVQCIKLWGQSGTIETGIKYKENTPYSFVLNYVGTTMSTKNDIGSLYFVYTDGTQNLLTYFTGTTSKGIRRYTSNPNKTLKTIRWYAWAPSQAIYLATNELQLVEGSEQYNLIQHQEQNYPLSLGNIELAKQIYYKDYIFKNVIGSPYYNADLELNEWYLHKENIIQNLWQMNWIYDSEYSTPVPRTVLRLEGMISRGNYLSNCFLSSEMDNQQITNRLKTNSSKWFIALANSLTGIEATDSSGTKLNKIITYLQSVSANIYYGLATPTNTKITDTTLIQQLENINNNARSYSDTTIIICSSESEDNETIQASVTALKDISTLFEQVNNAIIEIGGGE